MNVKHAARNMKLPSPLLALIFEKLIMHQRLLPLLPLSAV